jgi:uncharacterized iron-regulated protein
MIFIRNSTGFLEFRFLQSTIPLMSTKSSDPTAASRKHLLARISAAEKQADSAKRMTKLAKLVLRQAKKKFKDSKHAAKALRKAVKALKEELSAMAMKKSIRRPGARKPTVKRAHPVTAFVSVPTETPPISPATL